MKALVPFNRTELLEEYIKAGTGEFYLGFYDPEWIERFGEYGDLNRLSGYKECANQNKFEDVLEIIKRVKAAGKDIFVTFNAALYTQEMINFMERYFDPLKEVGADGAIISCMELMEPVKRHGLNVVISTIAGVYNEDIAKFYYDHGAKRIILPRDLSVDEIEEITKAVPDVEYEIFMMRNGCQFSDSNCLGQHRVEMPAICNNLNNANREIIMGTAKDFKAKHDIELTDMIYHNMFHTFACGLCSIYRFVKMGITAGKIVGRTDDWEGVLEDVRAINENVEIAKECSSNEEYLEKMVFPNDHRVQCKMGLNCYYPGERF